MTKTMLRVTATALVFATASPLLADEPPARAGTSVRAKSLIGTKVSVRGGTSVGTVEDIVLSEEGVVDYLIVAAEGKLVSVPWDATKVDYEKRSAVIDIPVETYRKIPTYSVERYPNFYAPTYRETIYKSYGLTPGAARRLERRIDRRP